MLACGPRWIVGSLTASISTRQIGSTPKHVVGDRTFPARAFPNHLSATFIHIDPTDDDSVEAAAARVGNEYGHLDVLINNEGTAAPRLGVDELTADAEDAPGLRRT